MMTDVYTFSPGDIVAFRFPRRDGESYARPCLVVEAGDDLLIAYGTTSTSDANRGHDILVREEYPLCGLDRPTRFVCARRIRVHPSDPRIEPCPRGGPPVLGHLTDQLIEELGCVLTQMLGDYPTVEARMAAERQGIHPGGPRVRWHLRQRRANRSPVIVERTRRRSVKTRTQGRALP